MGCVATSCWWNRCPDCGARRSKTQPGAGQLRRSAADGGGGSTVKAVLVGSYSARVVGWQSGGVVFGSEGGCGGWCKCGFHAAFAFPAPVHLALFEFTLYRQLFCGQPSPAGRKLVHIHHRLRTLIFTLLTLPISTGTYSLHLSPLSTCAAGTSRLSAPVSFGRSRALGLH